MSKAPKKKKYFVQADALFEVLATSEEEVERIVNKMSTNKIEFSNPIVVESECQ